MNYSLGEYMLFINRKPECLYVEEARRLSKKKAFYVVIYVGMCVAAFLFVVILASATATIFKIVLYQYIKNGTFPDNFPEMIIKEAFKSK